MEATPNKIATACSFNDQGSSRGTDDTNENGPQNMETSLECVFCREQFAEKGALYTHLWSHTDQDTVKCPVCGVELHNNWNLRCHYSLHGLEPPFECIICKGRFPEKLTLRQHIHAHSWDRPYQCLGCAAVFTKEKDRLEHIHGSWIKGWKCPDCGKRIHGKKKFQLHAQGHRIVAKGLYPCPKCGEIFHWMKDLNKHNDTQHPKAELRCQACGKRFLSEVKFALHERTHRKKVDGSIFVGKLNNGNWACPACGKVFRGKKSIGSHKAAHRSAKGGYICPKCGEIFHFKKELAKHTCTMHPKGQIRCQDCGKQFFSEARLSEHGCLHRNSQDQCLGSEKSYHPSQGLLMHTASQHSNGVPSEVGNCSHPPPMALRDSDAGCRCSACGEECASATDLIQHLLTHSDKPFQCAICTERYPSERDLRTHYRRHFECSICGAGFETKQALDRHLSKAKRHKVSDACFDDELLQCAICKKYCPSKQLSEHYLSHYRCPVCPRVFETESIRNSHVAEHHKCQLCPMIFKTQPMLNSHVASKHKGLSSNKCMLKQTLNRHLGKRHKVSDACFGDELFQCVICKEHYPSKQLLSEHRLSHYKCPLCPRICATESIRNSHVAEHHKCQLCPVDMIFKTQAMLDSHVANQHEGLSSYECILCLGSFVGERALDDHMRNVHSNNITPIIE